MGLVGVLLLVLLLYIPSYTFCSFLCNHDDSSALLLFKNSFALNTSYSPFEYFSWPPSSYFSSKTETWKEGTDCCEWDGVTCDTNTMSGHVIGLDLSCSNLVGEFHPNSSLFRLRHLRQLNLAYNHFSGSSIPPGIAHLVHLTHLNFSRSALSGGIPSTISHLSKLLSLDLAASYMTFVDPNANYPRMRLDPLTWNKLIQNATSLRELWLNGVDMSSIRVSSFSLLTNFSSSLISLGLSATKLQGKFPTHLLCLPKLQILRLSYNFNLRGELPKSNWSSPLRSLSVSFTAFSGHIPNSIGHLKSLNSLLLEYCNFHGPLPSSLFNLTQLSYLLLSGNNLVGPIQRFCYSFPSLSALNLCYNHFTGSIGEFSTNSLKFLDLSNNKLQGDLPVATSSIEYFDGSNNELTGDIPSIMCNASSLYVLNLAHNNLTGLIPQCLGTLPSLWVLDLQKNNLHGSMPLNFSKTNAFDTIKLNGNQLEGPLPRSLTHCTALQVLDLGNNNIEDTFPYWLETLQDLRVLTLRSNQFHGVITCFPTKHPFPMLRIFDVSNNNFSGALPESCIKNFQGMMNVNDSQTGWKYMGNQSSYIVSIVIVTKGINMEFERILTAFTIIDLSNNMFEGELPKVIGELHSLKGLNLSHNRITGSIPLSVGNLRNLESLDLSWNQLTGEIPMALTNLNFLEVLNLSENQLEGIIPTGGQFNTFGNDSYVGNPMLCGVPLSKECTKDEEWKPHSTFDNEEYGFGWKGVAVGYASGVLFGMLLAYKVFMTRKPQWLARLVEGVPYVRVC